jgi:hypothetical protein
MAISTCSDLTPKRPYSTLCPRRSSFMLQIWITVFIYLIILSMFARSMLLDYIWQFIMSWFGALAEYEPSRIIEIALSIGINELIENHLDFILYPLTVDIWTRPDNLAAYTWIIPETHCILENQNSQEMQLRLKTRLINIRADSVSRSCSGPVFDTTLSGMYMQSQFFQSIPPQWYERPSISIPFSSRPCNCLLWISGSSSSRFRVIS